MGTYDLLPAWRHCRARRRRRAATTGRDGVPDSVEALLGEGTDLSAIRLRDGSELLADALFIGPTNRLNSDLPERLGCTLEQGLLGTIVTVDEMKATNVQGVFAAGDITRSGHTVTFAGGVMAALTIHRFLAFGA